MHWHKMIESQINLKADNIIEPSTLLLPAPSSSWNFPWQLTYILPALILVNGDHVLNENLCHKVRDVVHRILRPDTLRAPHSGDVEIVCTKSAAEQAKGWTLSS